MVIWGGNRPPFAIGGGRYDPASDSWTSTSSTNSPTLRANHSAVWTGSRMIVWGGSGGTTFNSGGRYDPATDFWTPTSVANLPTARDRHSAVWTGNDMIVWGGSTPAGSLSS